jgi:hypothetical protein
MQLRWRNPHKPRAAMVLRPLGQRQPLRLAARPIRECRSLNTKAKRGNRRRRCYTMGRRVNRRRLAQPIRLRETQFVRSRRCTPALLSAATRVRCAERGLIHTKSSFQASLLARIRDAPEKSPAGQSVLATVPIRVRAAKARARVTIAAVTPSAVYQTPDACRGKTEQDRLRDFFGYRRSFVR